MTNPKINIIDVASVGGFDFSWKKHANYIDWSLSFEPNESPVLSGKNLKGALGANFRQVICQSAASKS
jgi:hypothetical protein